MAEQHHDPATHSRDLPSSWRYIKARLRILQRPAVWGSTILVLLTILVFFEYWRRSDELGQVAASDSRTGVASLDQLPADGATTGNAPLPSEEDSAIGADIDTLPLLLNDLNSPSPSTNERNQQDKQQGDRADNNRRNSSQTRSDRSNRETDQRQTSPSPDTTDRPGTTSSTSGSSSSNPFGALLSNNFSLLPSPSSSSGTRSTIPSAGSGLSLLGNFSTNFLTENSSTTATTAAPINPLTEALQRSDSSLAPSGSSQSNTSALAQALSTTQSSDTTPSLTNPYGTLYSNPYAAPYSNPYGVNQVPPFLYTPSAISNTSSLVQQPMQVSPPMGSTGYTLPPSLRGVPSSAPNATVASPYTNSFQTQPIRSFPTAPQIVPSAIPLQPSATSGQSSAFPTTTLGTSTQSSGIGSMPQFRTPQAIPQQSLQQMPYSVPNRVPGRYIGNGEINTFANP